MDISTQTGDLTLLDTHRGVLIDCTGIVGQLITMDTTLGDKWACTIRNSSAGTTFANSKVTLDASTGNVIVAGASAATFDLYPGDVMTVTCDGTDWNGVLLSGRNDLWSMNTAAFVWSSSGTGYPGANTLKGYLAATNDVLTVEAATRYQFEAMVDFSCPGAASHNIQFGFGGTATFTDLMYMALAQNAGLHVVTNANMKATVVATAAALTAASATAANVIWTRGEFLVNAAGTIIPSIATSADPSPAADNSVLTGSFFRAWKIGNSTAYARGVWA